MKPQNLINGQRPEFGNPEHIAWVKKQQQEIEDDYDPEEDDGDAEGFEYCDKCGNDYDEIDYEYQICSRCKHSRNPEP